MNKIQKAKELLGDDYVIVPINTYNKDSELIAEVRKLPSIDIKEAERFLDVAIEEINYSFDPHKNKVTKKFYLENAIRFINRAKEKLNV